MFALCIIFDVLKTNNDCSRKSKNGKILQGERTAKIMTHICEKQPLLGLEQNLEQNLECRLMSNSLKVKPKCEDEIRL